MSQKNIDCLAGFFDAFNRRDLPALLKCCDVDIEADYGGILIGTPTYRGHAGIEQLFRDMAAAWEELRSDRMEVIADGGDDLVLVGEAVGRGRTTGAPFVAQGALHVRFTRGKVVGMRGFRSEREAFEAAGIPGLTTNSSQTRRTISTCSCEISTCSARQLRGLRLDR